MNINNRITDAYKNIRSDIYKTPLIYSPELSERTNAKIFLKMENQQKTGSFKIRGVLNKIHNLGEVNQDNILVAASTGNHAAAFCYAAEKFGFKGILFLPESISKTKLNAIKHSDVEKILYGKNCVTTEKEAALFAQKFNRYLIHPYNDIDIIAGQGTTAIEIEEQLPEVEKIFVPVGGGGLIAGISGWFSENEKVSVIGCQPVNASEMADSVKEGNIVPPKTTDTIADATAGGIEEDSLTFDFCRKYVSDFTLITEEEIKKAIAFMVVHHHTLVEPGAALSVAAALKNSDLTNKTVVLVITGKKINPDLLTNIMSSYDSDY
ncbi:MAG: threonine/serine dehydratase [Rhodothermaceae bacterium]